MDDERELRKLRRLSIFVTVALALVTVFGVVAILLWS